MYYIITAFVIFSSTHLDRGRISFLAWFKNTSSNTNLRVFGTDSHKGFLLPLKSAMLDLVDIFGPSPEDPPPPNDPWNAAQSSNDVTSDPWDSVGGWFITSTQI